MGLVTTNASDAEQFRHRLADCAGTDNGDQQSRFPLYLQWRESIRKLFHAQPLPNGAAATVNGVSYNPGRLSYVVWVKPLDVVDRVAWEKAGYFASGLVLRCVSREPRG